MEKFRSIDKIGDGTYGTVFKSINIETNHIIAIKKMKKNYSKWEECISMKEVKALVGLKHPNIITLNEMILDNSELFLIFEYVGQNLFEYTQKQMKNLPELKIRNIIYQILQGLAYMHRQNYFHRDMKPENILISGDIVKIADFGLAKEIRSRPPFTEYVSTRWYRSPEVILKSKNYNSPIDIFAVGAIMAELYNNKPIFPGKSEYDQLKKICEILGSPSANEWQEGNLLATKFNFKFPNIKGQKLKTIIPRASDIAINFLENILNFNPIKRPSASQCLQHPYFQCYDILSIYGLKLNNSISQNMNFIMQRDISETNYTKNKENYSNSLTNVNLNFDKKKNKLNMVNSINSLNSNTNGEISNMNFQAQSSSINQTYIKKSSGNYENETNENLNIIHINNTPNFNLNKITFETKLSSKENYCSSNNFREKEKNTRNNIIKVTKHKNEETNK